jgi:hypothetical protein
MRSEEIEEIFGWIVSEFGEKYIEAVREKNEDKQRIVKAALEGALRGFEHEVLLLGLDEIKRGEEG